MKIQPFQANMYVLLLHNNFDYFACLQFRIEQKLRTFLLNPYLNEQEQIHQTEIIVSLLSNI